MPAKDDMPAGPTLQLITYDDGIDTEEEWSQSWEGKDHDVGISLIHLSTTKDDSGPPLHFHPYPETIMVRRGNSTVTIGEQELEGNAGLTVVIPANTPHTFRTHGPERYESIAIHSSPTLSVDEHRRERRRPVGGSKRLPIPARVLLRRPSGRRAAASRSGSG